MYVLTIGLKRKVRFQLRQLGDNLLRGEYRSDEWYSQSGYCCFREQFVRFCVPNRLVRSVVNLCVPNRRVRKVVNLADNSTAMAMFMGIAGHVVILRAGKKNLTGRF